MTQITLSIKKSVDQNASTYFEKAKKAKKKIEGVKEALIKLEKNLSDVSEKEIIVKSEEKLKKIKEKRKQEWYEKFHWFISSEGFLCVGGRDATSNEIIIKKHADKEDFVFHTEAPGSPFFVIKVKDKKPTEKTFKEVAAATAAFSKAWKLGLGTAEVYMIKPDQVKKELGLPKGSFMIHGKRKYFRPALILSIGTTKKGMVMSGPESAVKKNCDKYVNIEQGREKTSAVAKSIHKKIGGDLDEIIRALPAGGCKIKR